MSVSMVFGGESSLLPPSELRPLEGTCPLAIVPSKAVVTRRNAPPLLGTIARQPKGSPPRIRTFW